MSDEPNSGLATEQLPPPTVSITPEMREIMQMIVNNLTQTRNQAEYYQKHLAVYINQCGKVLDIDPSLIHSFDLPTGRFILHQPDPEPEPVNKVVRLEKRH